MRTSAAGNRTARPGGAHRAVRTVRAVPTASRPRGFTLLELLVVLAIIAFATVGVSFALRQTGEVQLEREAQRLASLFESARAQSRSTGIAVRWYPTETGFRFEGVPPDSLPERWLSADTRVQGPAALLLGPEPIIGRQQVVLASTAANTPPLRIATDGLRPFTVSPVQTAAP